MSFFNFFLYERKIVAVGGKHSNAKFFEISKHPFMPKNKNIRIFS